MDDVRFDQLTRRLVLGGFVGGSLAAPLVRDGATAKRKRRKTKNKKKTNKPPQCSAGRNRCGNHCCPPVQSCANQACAATCNFPFFCGGNATSCGGSDNCLCTRQTDNSSFCADGESGALCDQFAACDSNDDCPAGRICALCTCDGQSLDHRCLKPCPTA